MSVFTAFELALKTSINIALSKLLNFILGIKFNSCSIPAEDFTEEKKARSLDNDLDAESSLPFEVPSVAPALHGFARPNNRVLPGGTFLIADRSCWTPDGQFGTCTSMRSCYPNTRLPSQKDLDSWLLSARATCAFVESDGRQVTSFLFLNFHIPNSTLNFSRNNLHFL